MDLTQCLNIAGATYHVMNRGNRKVPIFVDDRDRRRFNGILIETKAKYHVDFLCGTQQVTHFHAIVTTPHANLSEFMQAWEGDYARYFNSRHGFKGHLFEGPFGRVIIENDLHLFTAVAYVFKNPVVAGMVSRAEEWKWSTYSATAGLGPAFPHLSTTWLETLLPAESLRESQELLRRCMADPRPVQAYLQAVDPTSAAALRSYIFEQLHSLPQPCSYRMLTRPSLGDLFSNLQGRSGLAEQIESAHEAYGYKLAEIAKHLSLHPGSISRIYRATRRARSMADPAA